MPKFLIRRTEIAELFVEAPSRAHLLAVIAADLPGTHSLADGLHHRLSEAVGHCETCVLTEVREDSTVHLTLDCQALPPESELAHLLPVLHDTLPLACPECDYRCVLDPDSHPFITAVNEILYNGENYERTEDEFAEFATPEYQPVRVFCPECSHYLHLSQSLAETLR